MIPRMELFSRRRSAQQSNIYGMLLAPILGVGGCYPPPLFALGQLLAYCSGLVLGVNSLWGAIGPVRSLFGGWGFKPTSWGWGGC